jgi:hypothetical protein
MKATRYSQSKGFEDVEIDDKFYFDMWDRSETFKSWGQIDGVCDYPGSNRAIHCWLTGDKEWPEIVTISSVGCEVVVFSSSADRVAYMHQFATPMQTEQLDRLQLITGKMFRAMHGHSTDTICQSCDPEGWRHMQNRLQRAANAS